MEDKKDFINGLSHLLNKYYNSIESLEYFKPGKEYNEEVVLTYKGGYQETVNVSCDSIPELLRDVSRYLDL